MLRMHRDPEGRPRRITVARACEKISNPGLAPIRSHGEAYSVKFYKVCLRTLISQSQRDAIAPSPESERYPGVLRKSAVGPKLALRH